MLKKIIAQNRLSYTATNRSSSSVEVIIPKKLNLNEIEANILYSKYIKINNLYSTNKIQKYFYPSRKKILQIVHLTNKLSE